MQGPFDLDREGVLDSVVNLVPLTIIALLTLLFVAYNPWGWQDRLLIAVVFGLHLVPIIVLAPVTYLVVRVIVEAGEGRSETAERVTTWFALADCQDGDANPPGDGTADDR